MGRMLFPVVVPPVGAQHMLGPGFMVRVGVFWCREIFPVG